MRILNLKNLFKTNALPPSGVTGLITILFFIIFEGLLHPGYAINDDLKIISIIYGFPAGDPAPFLVSSNVLLGFLLQPLYAFHSSLNWEILLFSAINFFSVWGLLYIIFSRPMNTAGKFFGGTIILACAAYFALNITFTNVALLACFSGICLFFLFSSEKTSFNKAPFICGMALVLIGSLIRIEMLVLILPVILAGLLFLRNSLNIKILVIGFVIAGLFVSAGYAFDKLYVRTNQGWHTYYFYNKTRQMVHDSHILENLHSEIHRVGWSSNDQELFARWFFPDKETYSLDRLQYLVAHIPGTSQDLRRSVTVFIYSLARPQPVALIIFMAAISLWALSQRHSKRMVIALLTIWGFCIMENQFLVWSYKDPDYVLMSLIACSTIFGLLIMSYEGRSNSSRPPFSIPRTFFQSLTFYGSLLFITVGVGMTLLQSLETSITNINKQTAYQGILADLSDLQLEGKIPKNSLIISPAHGLPMEWSNPFILELPRIPYFDTGWSTFSPAYEEVLQTYKIQSLPDALYQNNNIYLMTRSNFTLSLARYYQEHENLNISFQSIYNMPNTYNFSGYDDIHLYKVVNNK
jgi:hypothetical protein